MIRRQGGQGEVRDVQGARVAGGVGGVRIRRDKRGGQVEEGSQRGLGRSRREEEEERRRGYQVVELQPSANQVAAFYCPTHLLRDVRY
eukprot:864581-Rhodomonas_salina.3